MPTSAEWYAWRARTSIELRLMLANTAGAVFIFVYLTFLDPGGAEIRTTAGIRANVIVFAIYMTTTLCVGEWDIRRRFRPVYRWLAEDRPPTEEERAATLAQPGVQAMWRLPFWIAAAALFGWLNLRFDETGETTRGIVFGTLLAGMTTSALGYLLVERRMRPIFAKAFASAPPQRSRTLGVLPRLLLMWLLGSALPLVGIGLSQIGIRPDQQGDLKVATWFLVGAGLMSGLVVTVAAARSVADPLKRVRTALRAVQSGRTDVQVVVDDGGDIGLLQSGVNAMVDGLRERQLLRDLFGRHVGDEVASAALERGLGLGGEQHEASALFVDLIGSTRLAQQRSPDEVVRVLNALFTAVVDAVSAEGGWVNKFDGDGALAVYGPPTGQLDHAASALRTARVLRARLRELAADDPAYDAGIGVSCGTVVAGNVGSEERYEYTVIGDPVNEAARLTVLAKERPSRILASARAVAAADGEAQHWRAAGNVELRGRADATEVYEPVA